MGGPVSSHSLLLPTTLKVCGTCGIAPVQYCPSQSHIWRIEPGAWSAARRRSSEPNSDTSSLLYASIDEPSADAPGETSRLLHADASARSAAAAQAARGRRAMPKISEVPPTSADARFF